MSGVSGEVELREVEPGDLPAIYEHQADPVASAMAEFRSRDRPAFDAHWAKVLADPAVMIRTIVVDGEVAGAVQSWPGDGQRLAGYWIGRELWGRGIASAALAQFLELDRERPLHAHVAKANAGSRRVLEKCGFVREADLDDGLTYVLRS
jgi:RimJ/RimL family protein N-acetyltransferase